MKKTTAILLLLSCSFFVPGQKSMVRAQETTPTIAYVGETPFSDLQQAVGYAVQTEQEVDLAMSIPLTSSFVFPKNYDTTLDFNGYTITLVNRANRLTNCASMVLKDSSPEGKGGIHFLDGGFIQNYGNLVIESGTYIQDAHTTGRIVENQANNSVYLEQTFANPTLEIRNGYFESGYTVVFNSGTFILQDGTLKSTSSNQYGQNLWSYAVINRKNGQEDPVFTMNGGKIEGIQGALACDDGIASIYGGSIHATPDSSISFYALYSGSRNATVNVYGGNYLKGGATKHAIYAEPFDGTGGARFYQATVKGSFLRNFEDYLDVNAYYTFEEATNEYTIQSVQTEDTIQAIVNGKAYQDLALAVTEAQNGQVVILTKDLTLTSAISVDPAKEVTIDFNAHTLTMHGNYFISNGGKLTLRDSSVTEENKSNRQQGGVFVPYLLPKEDSYRGAIENLPGATLIIENGAYMQDNPVRGATIWNEGSLHIKNGYVFSAYTAIYTNSVFQMDDGFVKSISDNSKVNAAGTKTWSYTIISATATADTTILAGRIEGIQGAVAITGGKAVFGNETKGPSIQAEDENTVNKAFYAVYVYNETADHPTAKIYNGTYKGAAARKYLSINAPDGNSALGNVTIYGGDFSSDVRSLLAPDYKIQVVNQTYVVEKTVGVSEAKIAYYTINFASSYGIRIFILKDAIDLGNVTISCVKEDYDQTNEVTLQETSLIDLGVTTKDGLKYQVFGVNNIYAFEMTSRFYIDIYQENETETIKADQFEISVASYANQVFTLYLAGESAITLNEVNMIKYFLLAGNYAQLSKQYNLADLAENYIPTELL